jgi:hypothetical protein
LKIMKECSPFRPWRKGKKKHPNVKYKRIQEKREDRGTPRNRRRSDYQSHSRAP